MYEIYDLNQEKEITTFTILNGVLKFHKNVLLLCKNKIALFDNVILSYLLFDLKLKKKINK